MSVPANSVKNTVTTKSSNAKSTGPKVAPKKGKGAGAKQQPAKAKGQAQAPPKSAPKAAVQAPKQAPAQDPKTAPAAPNAAAPAVQAPKAVAAPPKAAPVLSRKEKLERLANKCRTINNSVLLPSAMEDDRRVKALQGSVPFRFDDNVTRAKHPLDGAMRDYVVTGRFQASYARAIEADMSLIVVGVPTRILKRILLPVLAEAKKVEITAPRVYVEMQATPKNEAEGRWQCPQVLYWDSYEGLPPVASGILCVNIYGVELKGLMEWSKTRKINITWVGHDYRGPAGATFDSSWHKVEGGAVRVEPGGSPAYTHPDPSTWIFDSAGSVDIDLTVDHAPRCFDDPIGHVNVVHFVWSATRLDDRGAPPPTSPLSVERVPAAPVTYLEKLASWLTPGAMVDGLVHKAIAEQIVREWAVAPVSGSPVTTYTRQLQNKLDLDATIARLKADLPDLYLRVVADSTRYMLHRRLMEGKNFQVPFFKRTAALAYSVNAAMNAYGREPLSGPSLFVRVLPDIAAVGAIYMAHMTKGRTIVAMSAWIVARQMGFMSASFPALPVSIKPAVEEGKRLGAMGLETVSTTILQTKRAFIDAVPSILRGVKSFLLGFRDLIDKAIEALPMSVLPCATSLAMIWVSAPVNTYQVFYQPLVDLAISGAEPMEWLGLILKNGDVRWGLLATWSHFCAWLMYLGIIPRNAPLAIVNHVLMMFSGGSVAAAASPVMIAMNGFDEEIMHQCILQDYPDLNRFVWAVGFSLWESWFRGLPPQFWPQLMCMHLVFTCFLPRSIGPLLHGLNNYAAVCQMLAASTVAKADGRSTWLDFKMRFHDTPWESRQNPDTFLIGGLHRDGSVFFDPTSRDAFVPASRRAYFPTPQLVDIGPDLLRQCIDLIETEKDFPSTPDRGDGVYYLCPTSSPMYRPDASSPVIKVQTMLARQFAGSPMAPLLQVMVWESHRDAHEHLADLLVLPHPEIDGDHAEKEFWAHIRETKGTTKRRHLQALDEEFLEEIDIFSPSVLKVGPFTKGDEVLMRRGDAGEVQLKPRTICAITPQLARATGPYTYEAGRRLKELWAVTAPHLFSLPKSSYLCRISYGTACTQEELGDWATVAVAQQRCTVSIIVHGDDCLVVLIDAFGHLSAIEGDFGQFDNSQGSGPLSLEQYMEKNLGIPDHIGDALFASCHSPISMKVKGLTKPLSKKRSHAPTRNTGSSRTSLGNSLNDGFAWCAVLDDILSVKAFVDDREAFRAETAARFAHLGYKVTIHVRAQVYGATFLKGWFFPLLNGNVGYGPLPSRVLKFGKIGSNPRRIYKLRPQDPEDTPFRNAMWDLSDGLAYFYYLDPLCAAMVRHWQLDRMEKQDLVREWRDNAEDALRKWYGAGSTGSLDRGSPTALSDNRWAEVDAAFYAYLVHERYGFSFFELQLFAADWADSAKQGQFRFMVSPIFEAMTLVDYA